MGAPRPETTPSEEGQSPLIQVFMRENLQSESNNNQNQPNQTKSPHSSPIKTDQVKPTNPTKYN